MVHGFEDRRFSVRFRGTHNSHGSAIEGWGYEPWSANGFHRKQRIALLTDLAVPAIGFQIGAFVSKSKDPGQLAQDSYP
jgi:hypothetical protein